MSEPNHIWVLCEINYPSGSKRLSVFSARLFGSGAAIRGHILHTLRARSYRVLADKKVRMSHYLSFSTGPSEIITGDDGTRLRDAVNERLADGWRLASSCRVRPEVHTCE